jgi:hypothetical protein
MRGLLPLVLADRIRFLRHQHLASLVEPDGVLEQVPGGEQCAREALLWRACAVVMAAAHLRERERLAHLVAAGEEVGVPDDEAGPVAVLAAVEPNRDVARHASSVFRRLSSRIGAVTDAGYASPRTRQ